MRRVHDHSIILKFEVSISLKLSDDDIRREIPHWQTRAVRKNDVQLYLDSHVDYFHWVMETNFEDESKISRHVVNLSESFLLYRNQAENSLERFFHRNGNVVNFVDWIDQPR